MRLCLKTYIGFGVVSGGYSNGDGYCGLDEGHSLNIRFLLCESGSVENRYLQIGIRFGGLIVLEDRRERHFDYTLRVPRRLEEGHTIRHDLFHIGPALVLRFPITPVELTASYGYNWSTWHLSEEMYYGGRVYPDNGESFIASIKCGYLAWSFAWHSCRATARYALSGGVELQTDMLCWSMGLIF